MQGMDINEYIQQKKLIQDLLLNYLENDNNDNENFKTLCQLIEKQNIQKSKEEYAYFLFLLCKISKNHYRGLNFFQKIEQIIIFFKLSIKQVFTNYDLYNIFKKSKRILLFLFENKIILIDEIIFNLILKKNDSEYFYTEIKRFLTNDTIKQRLLNIDSNIFSYFEEMRQKGENDSYICQLIRGDQVVEFITFVNKNLLSLSTEIKPSIFETNPFLIKQKETTLIEYAAFYGSIQIFQYLLINNVNLSPSLWLYAIHGKNAEIIHILEQNGIKLTILSRIECYKEAIKCHHNDIANYIEMNYMNNDRDYDYCYHYYNYNFFPSKFNNVSFLCNLCKFNYKKLVKLFFDQKDTQKCLNKRVFNNIII